MEKTKCDTCKMKKVHKVAIAYIKNRKYYINIQFETKFTSILNKNQSKMCWIKEKVSKSEKMLFQYILDGKIF